MKSFILVVFLGILSAQAHAGGDHMGNGGGLAEQNFIYAYQNMASWTDHCLEMDNPCAFTEKERRTLAAIHEEAKERKDNSGLFFKSGKLNPGLFETDDHGKIRVAVTGSTKFSAIYINLDLIYTDATESQSVMDAYGALSILVHEMGHHTGETDHLFLDQLGNKVRGFREKFLESIDLKKFGHEELKLTAYNHDRNISEQRGSLPYPRTLISISNGKGIVDLTDELEKFAVCPAGEYRRSTHFTNITWHRLEAFDLAKYRQNFTFSLDVDFECRGNAPSTLHSVRVISRGTYKVMEMVNSGELVESRNADHWQIYDSMRFVLESSEIKIQP